MNKLTFLEFTKRAKIIHNESYLYPEQAFINTKTKIKIFCKRGNHYFKQLPSSHLL